MYDSHFVVIDSLKELYAFMSERVSSKHGEVIDVPIAGFGGHRTVICLSDIALKATYKECGIMIAQDSIRLSFSFGREKYHGQYLAKGKTLHLSETYTIRVLPGTVFNLILKENAGKAGYDFIVIKVKDDQQHLCCCTLLPVVLIVGIALLLYCLAFNFSLQP